tara:strand:- start:33 stop:599 length:567 start_codon:yes stop_codon:yes gene_type:complete
MTNINKKLRTISLTLACLGLFSCEQVDEYDFILSVEDQINFKAKAIIINGNNNSKYRTIYLDTLQSETYTSIYAEANQMPIHQRYNGENNIWATFHTPISYTNYDTNVNYSNVPYVASTSVRFDYARSYNGQTTGYVPTKLDLYTKQMVGPIHKSAIRKRDTIPVYMHVDFDGRYEVKDTLFIVLAPR